jgi:hypothetical protein
MTREQALENQLRELVKVLKTIIASLPPSGKESEAWKLLLQVESLFSTLPEIGGEGPNIDELLGILESFAQGYWYCPKCDEWVHGQQATFDETHTREGCGEKLKVIDDFIPEIIEALKSGQRHPERDLTPEEALVEARKRWGPSAWAGYSSSWSESTGRHFVGHELPDSQGIGGYKVGGKSFRAAFLSADAAGKADEGREK